MRLLASIHLNYLKVGEGHHVESKHCIPWLTASALSIFYSISKPLTLAVSWTAPSAGSSITKGAQADCVNRGLLAVYSDESMGLHLVHELLKVI